MNRGGFAPPLILEIVNAKQSAITTKQVGGLCCTFPCFFFVLLIESKH